MQYTDFVHFRRLVRHLEIHALKLKCRHKIKSNENILTSGHVFLDIVKTLLGFVCFVT